MKMYPPALINSQTTEIMLHWAVWKISYEPNHSRYSQTNRY